MLLESTAAAVATRADAQPEPGPDPPQTFVRIEDLPLGRLVAASERDDRKPDGERLWEILRLERHAGEFIYTVDGHTEKVTGVAAYFNSLRNRDPFEITERRLQTGLLVRDLTAEELQASSAQTFTRRDPYGVHAARTSKRAHRQWRDGTEPESAGNKSTPAVEQAREDPYRLVLVRPSRTRFLPTTVAAEASTAVDAGPQLAQESFPFVADVEKDNRTPAPKRYPWFPWYSGYTGDYRQLRFRFK